jgi:phosphate transport system substrate-binding protein
MDIPERYKCQLARILHKNIVESLKHQDKVKPDAQISVASSGTGGGMSKFCADEIDIVGASRPIRDEEITRCKKRVLI